LTEERFSMKLTFGVSKKSKFRTYFKYLPNSSIKEKFEKKFFFYVWTYQDDFDIIHQHELHVLYHQFFDNVLSMFQLLILATKEKQNDS
jgi:hypothetical protein